MTINSTAGEGFLKTLENWLDSQTEVLVLIRYSRAAGDKSFELYSSFPALRERLRLLPAQALVTVFRNPQLKLRGVVDDGFIDTCLRSLPDGPEFVVVETAATKLGSHSWFDYFAGESHKELKEALEAMRGRTVAVGEYPPWLEEGPTVISGCVPDGDGELKPGVY